MYIFGEIESGNPEAATAVAVVLLAVALLSTIGARNLERLGRESRA